MISKFEEMTLIEHLGKLTNALKDNNLNLV